ncbi:phosphatase PAP2 family protein [Salisaeta longa]|uniref:phosphatase PAP2 family protein n=1 Tax=Salisaeta longa TaxID=503170 RepID=UPI000688DD81|nr:phosphatase PAP2 family protein [Salisaeta longa]
MRTAVALVLIGLFGWWSGPVALGQSFCHAPHTGTLDVRGLRAVYCTPSEALQTTFRGAHASAYPVFYSALPVAWGTALATDARAAAATAYRLTVTAAGTYGLVLALKHLTRRPRPFVRLAALTSRSADYQRPVDAADYTAWPSGHAAMSAALATSISWSYPRWYVTAPVALWALSVGLSRIWLGVHYPSDVLSGFVLGVGVATAVHLLRGALTPARWQPAAPPPALVRLRIAL